MQTIQNWPTDTSALTPSVKVQIGGLFYEPISWIFDAESTSGLPGDVAGGSGISAAVATLTFPPSKYDVSQRADSPFVGGLWPPSRGDRVVIWAGYDGYTMAQLIDGVVDGISGGFDSDIVVEVVDRVESLRRNVWYSPIMATSPRLDWTSDTNKISRGLQSTYYLADAAARCGYYTVPYQAAPVYSVFYATMNGALIPTRGVVEFSEKHGATKYNYRPLWAPAPWGQGAKNILARINPSETSANIGRITNTRPLRMSFILGNTTSIGAGITAHWGTRTVQLQYDPNAGAVWLQTSIDGQTARSENVLLGVDEVVVASLNLDGGYVIRTSAGRSNAGTLGWHPDFQGTSITRVTVSVPDGGTQIAAPQVYFYDTWEPLTFKRNFHLDPASTRGTLDGVSAWSGTVLELINEISEAELSSAYINYAGELVLKNRKSLVSGTPASTKTSIDDLLSLPWAVPYSAVKRVVSVKGKNVHCNVAPRPQFMVYQGSGEGIAEGEEVVTFIEPKADEDYVAVMPFVWTWEQGRDMAGYPSQFNLGNYSWTIGSAGEDADEHYQPISGDITQIDGRKWLLKIQAGADLVQKVPSTPNNNALVEEKWRGENTPIIRAKGKMQYEDFTTQSSIEGPAWASDYEHDGGIWVQGRENAAAIADYISQWTASPLVSLPSVKIIPDARLERNDVILIRDDTSYDRVIRALITGVHLSGGSGVQEMTLDLQVIATSELGGTYDNQRTAYLPAGSYETQAAEYAAAGWDYAENSTKPTRRA